MQKFDALKLSQRDRQIRNLNQKYWRKKKPQAYNLYSMIHNRKIRLEVLRHYSNGKPKCVKCGIEDTRCLSIDHINGNGAEHRKELKKLRTNIITYLRKNNYPDGFQILCMNCQFIKRHENNENRKGKLPILKRPIQTRLNTYNGTAGKRK
jgi:plasmid maintenance system killer protein